MTEPVTTAIAQPALVTTARDLWAFVRAPRLSDASCRSFDARSRTGVVQLFVINSLLSLGLLVALSPVFALEGAPDPTALMELAKLPLPVTILLVVLIAPLVEEAIFRSWISGIVADPPGWYRTAFPFVYYLQAAGFGAIHFFNYGGGNVALTLVLVLPQFVAGLVWGYARVRQGWWANPLLHIAHNGALLLIGGAVSAMAS